MMDRSHFNLAKGAMHNSTMPIRVGCAIVDEVGVIGVGCNEHHDEDRSEPPWSIHAEIAALLEALRNGAPRSAYVYRETRPGVIADSKPCQWCQVVLRKYGVNQVYYTAKDGPHYRVLQIGGKY